MNKKVELLSSKRIKRIRKSRQYKGNYEVLVTMSRAGEELTFELQREFGNRLVLETFYGESEVLHLAVIIPTRLIPKQFRSK